MKVVSPHRSFGKYKAGEVFELKDKTAKILVRVGKLQEASPTYQTRMMQADVASTMLGVSAPTEHAPYGYKADGTPRLRPGRPAKSAE